MQDKHTYIIIGLLLVIIVMLFMLISANNKSVSDLLGKASEKIAACQENVSAWNAKYGGQGKVVTPAAKAELDTILAACQSDVNAAQEKI